MDNLHFPCAHCNNLMAAGPELAGQQVRCPHCQQVVVVPAPALAPAADGFPAPPRTDPESIFSPADDGGDALFGPVTPRVEMPPEPAAPAGPAAINADMTGSPAAAPDPSMTPAWPDPGAVSPQTAPLPFSPAAAPGGDGADALADAIPRPVIRAPQAAGWVLPVLVVPLISWSVLSTVAAAWLYFVNQSKPPEKHPLEFLPDVEGEHPGATRQQKKTTRIDYGTRPLLPVPAHLRVGLGNSVRVGDVEVTPEGVELGRVQIAYKSGSKPAESHDDVLVLRLTVRNVSEDVVFRPLDAFFVRQWKKREGQTLAGMPFTYLEAGEQRFFGGPVRWQPPQPHLPGRLKDPVEIVVGQDLDRELRPGEEVKTFLCTDPYDPVREELLRYRGPLLWRVQVRRGLVPVKGRDVPSTAVVGVEFTDADVKRPG